MVLYSRFMIVRLLKFYGATLRKRYYPSDIASVGEHRTVSFIKSLIIM